MTNTHVSDWQSDNGTFAHFDVRGHKNDDLGGFTPIISHAARQDAYRIHGNPAYRSSMVTIHTDTLNRDRLIGVIRDALASLPLNGGFILDTHVTMSRNRDTSLPEWVCTVYVAHVERSKP